MGAEIQDTFFDLPKEERAAIYAKASPAEKYALLDAGIERNRGNRSMCESIYSQMDPIVHQLTQKHDPRWDFHNCIMIRDNAGYLVQLHPNPVQERLVKLWFEAKKNKEPIRWLIPKARKEGVSTLAAGLFYHDTRSRLGGGRNTTIVGYCDENTEILRGMYETMLEEDNPCLRPTIEQKNIERIKFSNPHGIIRTWTAANTRAGRGDTIHNLHASEVAFWGDRGDETALALIQAIPKPDVTWDTAIILESTGNGDSGVFYDFCIEAAAGRNDWTLLFLPWNDFPYYTRPFKVPHERDKFAASLDTEEKHIKKQYSLTLEQLNWRRWTIRNDMPGSNTSAKKRKFRQEFPISLEECFQATVAGRTFDEDLCRELLRKAPKHPAFIGDIILKGKKQGDRYITGEPTLIRRPKGPLRIFSFGRRLEKKEAPDKATPRKSGQFAIGADTSEGVTAGDYSAAVIYDRDLLKPIAYWMGKTPPGVFAEKIRLLMKFYNDAYGGVEINSQGIAVIERLKDSDRYGFLYHQRDIARPGTPSSGRRLGWRTTMQTKPRLIGLIHDFLTHHGRKAKVPWEVMMQLANYIEVPSKPGSGTHSRRKWQAARGHHDDLVMALGIALVTHKECPYTPHEKGKKSDPSPFDRWHLPDREGEKLEDDILGTNY